MTKEVDDIEFEELLVKKRHKDVKDALEGITKVLNNIGKEDNAVIAEAIKKQGTALEKLAAAIEEQSKEEKPEINVEVDNKELLPLLKELKEGQDALTNAINSKLYVDSFKVSNTGEYGSEKTIDVIYKPINKVTIKD